MRKQGVVVMEFGPWKVVDPDEGSGIRNRHVVVDTSGPKPTKVWGPASRRDCEAWARLSYLLVAVVHGQVQDG